MKDSLIIIGCGGHAKVIADIVEKAAVYEIIGFVDNDQSLWGQLFLGYPVLGGEDILKAQNPDVKVIIGIGNNHIRNKLADLLDSVNIKAGTAIHPSVQLGKNVMIGDGTVIMANVAINTDTVIGRHCIVNTGATIDHDNIIGDYAHISPGAHLAGTVKVGSHTHICTGASLIPNVTVGNSVVVGAGAVIISDVSDNSTVVGVPAKPIKNID